MRVRVSLRVLRGRKVSTFTKAARRNVDGLGFNSRRLHVKENIHLRVTVELVVNETDSYWYARADRQDETEYDASGPDPLTAMTRLARLLYDELEEAK